MENSKDTVLSNIADLLQKIDCDDLIPRFEEHNIQIHHIPKLLTDKNMINELIPHIGDRLNFIEKYEKFSSQKKENDICSLQVENDGSLSSIIPFNNPFLQEKDLTSSNVTDTSDSDGTVIIPEDEHRQISCCSYEEFCKKIEMPDFNLIELLELAPMGKAIISFYNNKNCLNDCLRNKLVDIIMRHVFSIHCKHQLTHKNYQSIVTKIKNLFPNEPPTVYYVAAIRKQDSPTGKTVIAKGKLIDKAKNLIYQGGYARLTKKRKAITDNINETPEKQKIDLSTNDSYLWLSSRNEPWEQVLIHWKNTFQLRQNSEVTTAFDFIKQWPILKQSNVDTLINSNFDELFPNRSLNLFKYWNLFFDKVIHYKQGLHKDILKIDIENLESLSESEYMTIPELNLANL